MNQLTDAIYDLLNRVTTHNVLWEPMVTRTIDDGGRIIQEVNSHSQIDLRAEPFSEPGISPDRVVVLGDAEIRINRVHDDQ